MQFEEFDKKIKEAADNHHPAYNDKAWGKMEKLLDTHLPQKKDKRRRFLLFFLFFLTLGGAGVVYTLVSKNNKDIINSDKPVILKSESSGISPDTGMQADVSKLKLIPAAGDDNKTEKKTADQSSPSSELQDFGIDNAINTLQKKQLNNTLFSEKKGDAIFTVYAAKKKKRSMHSDILPGRKPAVIGLPVQDNVLGTGKTGNDSNAIVKKTFEISVQEKKSSEFITRENDFINKKAVDSSTEKTGEPIVKIPEKKSEKSKKRNRSTFFITLSAGPDVSFTNSDKPGRIISVSGAGIGYTYKERLTLRAGFYTARKVYSASPEAYNPPPGFYSYYPYLEKVDASCKVYEIPVTLSYKFAAGKRYNLFASGGLSSYLMKKETYDYYYKTYAWGPTLNSEWTISNKNNHFFSVLTLSAGYQRNINKRVSIIAEPYFKLPLSGVGYGKVKLNSAGILFSVGIKPFVH